MLTTHRNVKSKNDIKWMENFYLVKEFKEKFNRFPLNKEAYKGVNIGKWCSRQRTLYVKESIERERMDLLNSIQFVWNVDDMRWLDNYNLVIQFKKEFKRFPYFDENYKGVNIGYWCNQQRTLYHGKGIGILDENRIKKLNRINFNWNSPIEDKWMKNFKLLKEFKEEFKRFPKYRELYKNFKLGVWCVNQSHLYKIGKMDKKRIDLLKSIDFI